MATALQARYLGGGQPAHPISADVEVVFLDEGFEVTTWAPNSRAHRVRVLGAPWGAVDSMIVEGPAEVEKRVTVTRMLALGLFSFAAKTERKVAYLVFMIGGGEIIFETRQFSVFELRGKLATWLSVANSDAIW